MPAIPAMPAMPAMPASASDSRDDRARGEAYRVLFGAPSTWGRSTGQCQRRKPALRYSVVMNAGRETSASNPSGTPGVHHEVSCMFARVHYRALRYCSRGISLVRCSCEGSKPEGTECRKHRTAQSRDCESAARAWSAGHAKEENDPRPDTALDPGDRKSPQRVERLRTKVQRQQPANRRHELQPRTRV
jgi:hypothetical protein